MAAYLRAEVGKRRAERDEPHRDGGEEVEVEPEHDEIERAMDGAMQCAKSNEDPGGVYVHRIHLIRDEEIERERIEKHRNLEQVLEVVRGIGHTGRREPYEGTGHGKLLRTEFVAGDETDAADVHVHPHEERQKDGREEGTEDCLLRHVVLTVAEVFGTGSLLLLLPHVGERLLKVVLEKEFPAISILVLFAEFQKALIDCVLSSTYGFRNLRLRVARQPHLLEDIRRADFGIYGEKSRVSWSEFAPEADAPDGES